MSIKDSMIDGVFIRMCRQATDLQNLRPNLIKNEDIYLVLPHECFFRAQEIIELGLQFKERIWIPTQKEMQNEILEGVNKYLGCMEKMTHEDMRRIGFKTLMDTIHSWAKSHDEFFTFDQIWLSYFMKYKFNKVWVNDEWIPN